MSRTPQFPPWAWALVAMILSMLCMLPTLQNGWVNWDDGAYVLRNPLIWDLSWEGLKNMFTTPEQVGLYHPLTLLSLAVDHTVWEKEAFGFHLTNLLLHLVNVSLVFVVMQRLSGKATLAFLVALLFGMHPMHVESVAWISARKDVLYTLFWLLSLWAYLNHRKSKTGRWIHLFLALLFFIAALLSKAMAFSLPLIFLLVDRWQGRKWSPGILLEKIPFFFLAIVALWVAGMGQQESDSMLAVGEYPFYKTVFIGMRNLLYYGFQAIFPFELSPFHPFPFMGNIELPIWYYLSAIPILGAGWILILAWKKWPKVFFGLALFLICIGPQLQIVPYGKAVTAERYTYVAYLGLFWVLAWGIEWLGRVKQGKWKIPLGVVAGVWLVFLGSQSVRQAKVWESGESLWSDVIEDYPEHYFGYFTRGKYRIEQGRNEAALADLNQAIGLEKEIAETFYERGRVHAQMENIEEAIEDYSHAIELKPGLASAYLNRGMLYASLGRSSDMALADMEAAIQADSAYALAHLNRGLILRGRNEHEAALESYDEAIRIEPWNSVFYMYRGVYNEALGRLDKAKDDFSEAHTQSPGSGESLYFRARIWQKMENFRLAIEDAKAAQNLGYDLPEGYIDGLRAMQ